MLVCQLDTTASAKKTPGPMPATHRSLIQCVGLNSAVGRLILSLNCGNNTSRSFFSICVAGTLFCRIIFESMQLMPDACS